MKLSWFRSSDFYWGVYYMREKECCHAEGGLVQCFSIPFGDSLLDNENNLVVAVSILKKLRWKRIKQVRLYCTC